MIHVRSSHLTTFLDRLTGRHLTLAAVGVTVIFAFGTGSYQNIPHGERFLFLNDKFAPYNPLTGAKRDG